MKFVFAILLFLHMNIYAQPLPITSLPFIDGMSFGSGLDVLDNTIVSNNPCIKDINISEGINRNQFHFAIQKIDNKNSLAEIFNFGFNANMNVGTFGVGIAGEYIDNITFKNNNYYMSISIDFEDYDYNLINPTMTNEALALYKDSNSYDDFRLKCGDKFLNTITTGGKYFGLLVIKTNSIYEKNLIDVELSGSYGVSIGSVNAGINLTGTLVKSLEKIEQKYETSITIISQGSTGENTFAITVEQFTDSANEFIKSFKEKEIIGENLYYQNPQKVRFEKYSTISLSKKGQDIDKIREILDEYIFFNEIYSNIIFDIDSILSYPYSYDNAIDQNDLLVELKKQLYIKQSQLRYLAELCTKKDPVERFCIKLEDIETLTFPTEWELRINLPLEKIEYPKTCDDRKKIYPNETANGEYRVYMSGDKIKPYSIYCDDMNTTRPQEYFTLQNSSFVSFGATKNYIYHLNAEQNESIVIYNKLKVKVSNEHLSIYSTQDKFIETIGIENEQIQFGVVHNKNIDSISRYNIDIVGTNFVFDSNLSINEIDYSDKVDIYITTIGDINTTLKNNQELNLKSTKPFSYISFKNELNLKYKEN